MSNSVVSDSSSDLMRFLSALGPVWCIVDGMSMKCQKQQNNEDLIINQHSLAQCGNFRQEHIVMQSLVTGVDGITVDDAP
jgi:hypothetical protein